jgi:hypothetical protein
MYSRIVFKKIRDFKSLIVLILLPFIFIACSDKELSKSDIVGIYGQKGDWYFKFDTTTDLRKYIKDPDNPPDWLLELEEKKDMYDGIVYMEKVTGEVGLGVWQKDGVAKWGGTRVYIIWQKYGYLNLSLYRDGNWYFKEDGSKTYFTASELDYKTKIATWPKQTP